MNPSKLKVVELRAELSARGLDTKGIKSVLVERLQEALDKESGNEGRKGEDAPKSPDTANESELNTSPNSEKQSDFQNQDDEMQPTDSENKQDNMDGVDEANDEVENQENNDECSVQKENGEDMLNDSKNGTAEDQPKESQDENHKTSSEDDRMEDENNDETRNDVSDTGSMDIKQEPVTDSGYNDAPLENSIKEEKDKEGYEAHVKTEVDGNDTKHVKSENDIKTEREYSREDRKRKRSTSPSPYKSRQSPVRQIKEEEPELNDSDVTLSWYDSDLNLTIDKDTFYTATPMTQGGFGYIWAGARGTYAYKSGKLCYQVKLVENCNVAHLEDEPNPNVLRVGWSTLDTSMQLGEEPLSYGYGGTGKISENCKFSNYGKPFGEGDVITAYLEFTDTEYVISYSVNGEHLEPAWQLQLDTLQDKALAPHILTKNVKFAVNFGQTEPWGEIMEGYTFLKNFPIEDAVAGPRRPEKRSDCEMIMMCGLPACGKTYWANNYVKEHPEKHYNILGTNALIDKMKVMGLPRKANYSGRWDILIDKCTKCLNKLMDVGSHRRRNYILDQTNVYPAAQRRKMRNFEGFTRKAVVIVPTEEEFKTRTQKQAQEDKKDVPENAVMEMKANFCLPDKSLFSEIIYAELDENEAKTLVHKYNKEASSAGFARKGPMGGGGGGSGSRGSGGPNAKRFRGDFGHGHGGGGHQQHHGGGGGQRHDGFRRGPPPSSPFRSQYRGPPGGGGGHGGGNGGRGSWQPPRGTPDRWRENRNHGGSGGGGGGGGYRQSGGGDRSGGGWRGGNQGAGNRGGRDYEDRNSRGGNFGNDRNRPRASIGGGGGGPRDSGRQGGGGYSSRDSGRDNWNKRGQGGSGSGGGSHNSGSAGGTISASNSQSNSQWGSYQSNQNQGQMTPSSGQSWGSQQSWGTPQQQQQWGNYQQSWKGFNQQQAYSQGYNQQQQQQGYSQQGYGNWQQYGYPGYQNWGQNWQNWYQNQNAATAGQTNTSQPPPSK